MDRVAWDNRDSEVDLESGALGSMEDPSRAPVLGVKAQPKTFLSRISCAIPEGLSKNAEELGNVMTRNGACEDYVKLEEEKTIDPEKVVKENHKKKSGKKPPKPPRPPRSPSVDAADLKLIKELSELAALRRARIERMKALKKLKAAKASSTSNSSGFLATMFTIFFCLVILFQGMSSRADYLSPEGSPVSVGSTSGGGLLSVQPFGSPSPGEQSMQGFPVSPGSIHTAGLDPPDGLQRAAS